MGVQDVLWDHRLLDASLDVSELEIWTQVCHDRSWTRWLIWWLHCAIDKRRRIIAVQHHLARRHVPHHIPTGRSAGDYSRSADQVSQQSSSALRFDAGHPCSIRTLHPLSHHWQRDPLPRLRTYNDRRRHQVLRRLCSDILRSLAHHLGSRKEQTTRRGRRIRRWRSH